MLTKLAWAAMINGVESISRITGEGLEDYVARNRPAELSLSVSREPRSSVVRR